MELCISRDWSRVLGLDRNADIAMLDAMAEEMSSLFKSDPSTDEQAGAAESLMNLMQDSFSTSIQISGPRATLAEEFSSELDQLITMYVTA